MTFFDDDGIKLYQMQSVVEFVYEFAAQGAFDRGDVAIAGILGCFRILIDLYGFDDAEWAIAQLTLQIGETMREQKRNDSH